MHGRTDHETNCRYRHLLTYADRSNVNDLIPQNGIIRFHIIDIESPTKYSVRLLESKSNTKWIPINESNEYLGFNMKFNSYYSDSDVHRIHHPMELGDLCVVIDNGKPYRCQIIQKYENM